MKLKDEVGVAARVKKCTNKICRDNHIHYTSLRLLFSIIMSVLMVTHWCYILTCNSNLLCMWEKFILFTVCS